MDIGYLFISNSSIPTLQQADSLDYSVNTFGLAPIATAKNMGYKLYVGVNRNYPENVHCDEFDIIFYDQHCYRNIFAIKDNIKALKNIISFLKKHSEIEVIHCNTPIGGMVGRIGGKICGVKKIIYTVHGFHFYKGAPLWSRTIIKWIECLLAHWTDAIITINQEDYAFAKKMKLRKGGKAYYVPGVGVKTEEFQNVFVDKVVLRNSLGLPNDAIVGISMGDVLPGKNFKTVIEAISILKNKNVHYLICGRGPQMDDLRAYSQKMGVSEQVHFLGFRSDIKELLKISDLYVFLSLREGLPRSTMEAMSAGLPCIVSKIRGHVDLIDSEKGGVLINPLSAKDCAISIERLINNSELRKKWGCYNQEKIKQFDLNVVMNKMQDIYNDILK